MPPPWIAMPVGAAAPMTTELGAAAPVLELEAVRVAELERVVRVVAVEGCAGLVAAEVTVEGGAGLVAAEVTVFAVEDRAGLVRAEVKVLAVEDSAGLVAADVTVGAVEDSAGLVAAEVTIEDSAGLVAAEVTIVVVEGSAGLVAADVMSVAWSGTARARRAAASWVRILADFCLVFFSKGWDGMTGDSNKRVRYTFGDVNVRVAM